MTCHVVRVLLLLLHPSAQAQAQECLIEKSTKGEQRPKPGVVARLASKVCVPLVCCGSGAAEEVPQTALYPVAR